MWSSFIVNLVVSLWVKFVVNFFCKSFLNDRREYFVNRIGEGDRSIVINVVAASFIFKDEDYSCL